MARSETGFTLTELMIAALASVILIGVAFSGLIALQQMTQKQDQQSVQEAELQRALRFMSRDIQASQSIQKGPPPSRTTGLFHLVRIAPSNQKCPDKVEPGKIQYISYYTLPKNYVDEDGVDRTRAWSGPQILMRRDSCERKPYALIDQIDSVLPERCEGVGTPLEDENGGLKAILVEDNKHPKTISLCLRRKPPSADKSVEASITVGAHAQPWP